MNFEIKFKQSAFRHGVGEADFRYAFTNPCLETMSEEEVFTLDEYYTNNPPKVDPSKARVRIPMIRVDSRTAEYLLFLSRTTRKTPGEIVSGLVQEWIDAVSEGRVLHGLRFAACKNQIYQYT
ncbi:MAG: hypothetical protein LBF80_04490 [Spirochaetaceae bacterium]|nr:hypothetical protein [Spirochaetaceae bacterium]